MDKAILTENLGLTPKEAAVYLAILQLGNSPILPIATQAGIKRTSIYYFIDHLVELGLVDKVTIRGKIHFRARPPESLVSLQKQRLAVIEKALPELLSAYNVSTSKPKISYYEGPEQMRNILYEETRCKKEVLGIWSAKEISELFSEDDLEAVDTIRRRHRVTVRAIRFQDKDEPFEPFQNQTGSYRELRYAPEGFNFPINLSVYDTGKVGFISSKKEGFGILIESEELIQAMRTVFELIWLQCRVP